MPKISSLLDQNQAGWYPYLITLPTLARRLLGQATTGGHPSQPQGGLAHNLAPGTRHRGPSNQASKSKGWQGPLTAQAPAPPPYPSSAPAPYPPSAPIPHTPHSFAPYPHLLHSGSQPTAPKAGGLIVQPRPISNQPVAAAPAQPWAGQAGEESGGSRVGAALASLGSDALAGGVSPFPPLQPLLTGSLQTLQLLQVCRRATHLLGALSVL